MGGGEKKSGLLTKTWRNEVRIQLAVRLIRYLS